MEPVAVTRRKWNSKSGGDSGGPADAGASDSGDPFDRIDSGKGISGLGYCTVRSRSQKEKEKKKEPDQSPWHQGAQR